jgi:hypothetical protein
MWRLLAILVVLSSVLSACGDDEEQPQRSEADRACPEGTPSLDARAVIGTTPDGYRVVRGDPAAIAQVADGVKRTLGPAFRGYDARVLARRRALAGTAVIVFNSGERIPGPDELLRQQEAAEQRAGVAADAISVGGADGRLYHAPDGGWVAVAPAGDCAMVLLVSEREALIRDAATLVMNDG